MSSGAELIDIERDRQCSDKGYDNAHDDSHTDGSLLHAALLIGCGVAGWETANGRPEPGGPWPDGLALHVAKKYGDDRIERLVIAGAMIAAEIDRLLRAEAKAT